MHTPEHSHILTAENKNGSYIMYLACSNLVPRNSEQVSIRASTPALVSLFSALNRNKG